MAANLVVGVKKVDPHGRIIAWPRFPAAALTLSMLQCIMLAGSGPIR